MKYFLLCVAFLFALPCAVRAQQYFQQEVNYTIHVSLNDVTHELTGDIRMEYLNNSPNSLSEIWMHLWPNAYKDESTALAKQLVQNGETNFWFADEPQHGYIDQLAFTVNDLPVVWEYDPLNIDICKLALAEPLQAGKSIVIFTPFHVKLPQGGISRLGHIDQAYQITQWYPKPAVYDRDGWHAMPYLDQGEFYSEYGSFDVSITLPQNYVVGATGDLQNAAELKWLDELAKKPVPVPKVKFESERSFPDMSFPESSTKTKTLRYTQSNIHDFAWFADKRFHVQKDVVILPHSGREVTCWAMFTNSEKHLWTQATSYLKDAIYYYSLWNGDYPYKQVTAVDGALGAGGGMEYPNVTVIGPSQTDFYLDLVITHEVGHNWFYGILGSNERDHPWMDEGINSMCEARYIATKYPGVNIVGLQQATKVLSWFDMTHLKYKQQSEFMYLTQARQGLDQPIEAHSTDYTMMNYGIIVYGKSGLVFDYLLAYLGDEMYDKCMRAYFEKWKFKHPQPDDFRAVVEAESGQNLSWFFEGLIDSRDRIDYKLKKVKDRGDHYEVTVKNKGQIASPLEIGTQLHGEAQTVWIPGFEGKTTVNVPKSTSGNGRVVIDPNRDMPDFNRNNNSMRPTGILRKMEPLRVQFLSGAEDQRKTQVFWSPVVGWNNYNHWMPGLAVHNVGIPQKKFEYMVVPMWSTRTASVTGIADFRYHFVPLKGPFRQITVSNELSQFHYSRNSFSESYYDKAKTRLLFDFQKPHAATSPDGRLSLTNFVIQESHQARNNTECVGFCPQNEELSVFNELKFEQENIESLRELNWNISVQHGSTEYGQLLSGMFEFDYRLVLSPRDRGVDLRLFAGYHFLNETNFPRYNWRMDGYNGWADYRYESVFLGRTQQDDLLSQQFDESWGGFKVQTPVGQSNKWLSAANAKIDLPLPLRPCLFGDIGYNAVETIAYDAGFGLRPIRGVFEVYVPLLFSSNIKSALEANDVSFGQRIRFTLYLNKLNPRQLIKSFEI